MASLSLSLRDYVGENELNYLQHRVGHHHVHVADARHLARLLHPLLVAHHLRTVGLLALVETHLLLLLLPFLHVSIVPWFIHSLAHSVTQEQREVECKTVLTMNEESESERERERERTNMQRACRWEKEMREVRRGW